MWSHDTPCDPGNPGYGILSSHSEGIWWVDHYTFIWFNIIVFVVVDKLASAGLEGEGADRNCSLTELDRKDIKCRNGG